MIKPLSVLSLAFLSASLSVHAEDKPFANLTGAELVDLYAKTQTVDSELAYIELKIFEGAQPGKDVAKRRFLALTEKEGGGFDYLIRLVRPEEVEGVSVLTNVDADDNVSQYIYLPAQGKPVQLAGAGRSGSFLGSDFAYEDLVREAPGNFDYERMDDAPAQGEECAVVRAYPKDDLASAYAYRDIFIDPTSYEIRKVVFYGESGEPVKELQAYEYRSPDVDGKTVRPRFAVMKNHETKTISVFKVLKSRLDLPLKHEYFDSDYLSQMTPADVNGLLSEIDVLAKPQ